MKEFLKAAKRHKGVFKKEDDFKKVAAPLYTSLINCLAAATDGELAAKVSRTPWLLFADEDMMESFASHAALKKDVDRTMYGYKQHFEMRLKEFEVDLKAFATIEQFNSVSSWAADTDQIMENNIRPLFERLQKQMTTVSDDVAKLKSQKKVASTSPFLALQFRLAGTVAAGAEAAIGEIREMLFTASALNVDNPDIKTDIDAAIRKLQTVGGSRLNRAAMWDVVQPVCVNKQARALFASIATAVKADDEERKHEQAFKFKTYNHAARSRPTNADLASRNSVVSVRDSKTVKSEKASKRRSVMDPKRFKENYEAEMREHVPSEDDEPTTSRSGHLLWESRKSAINDKLAKHGLFQPKKRKFAVHYEDDDRESQQERSDDSDSNSD